MRYSIAPRPVRPGGVTNSRALYRYRRGCSNSPTLPHHWRTRPLRPTVEHDRHRARRAARTRDRQPPPHAAPHRHRRRRLPTPVRPLDHTAAAKAPPPPRRTRRRDRRRDRRRRHPSRPPPTPRSPSPYGSTYATAPPCPAPSTCPTWTSHSPTGGPENCTASSSSSATRTTCSPCCAPAAKNLPPNSHSGNTRLPLPQRSNANVAPRSPVDAHGAHPTMSILRTPRPTTGLEVILVCAAQPGRPA